MHTHARPVVTLKNPLFNIQLCILIHEYCTHLKYCKWLRAARSDWSLHIHPNDVRGLILLELKGSAVEALQRGRGHQRAGCVNGPFNCINGWDLHGCIYIERYTYRDIGRLKSEAQQVKQVVLRPESCWFSFAVCHCVLG